MAENLVDKAVREAEEACQLAVASTPKQYREFMVLIPQSKRVGGTKQNPIYANIRLPYMGVDGRVRMAMDEHRTAGGRLTIDTIFETVGDKMTCRAIVNSSILGSAAGHSFVNFEGSGVDKTNPIENAETSAVGRALGFLGYGTYGTGIASAEEVLAAMSEQTRQRAEAMTPEPEPSPEPASDKQKSFLLSLLKDCGVLEGDKRKLIDFAYGDHLTKQAATEAIEFLKEQKTLPAGLRKAYIKMLVQDHGHDRHDVAAHMDKQYGHHDPAKLNNAQFTLFVEHLAGIGQPQEPDDIYLPGELVKDVTAEDWFKFMVSVCTACGITDMAFQKWVLSQWGNGMIDDISKLPKEAYHSLTAMDTDAIKLQVMGYDTVDSDQGVLVS